MLVNIRKLVKNNKVLYALIKKFQRWKHSIKMDLYYKKRDKEMADEILDFFRNDDRDQEYIGELNFISQKGRACFAPYPFADNYTKWRRVNAHFESDSKLYYVEHEGKKLFFPRDFSKTDVKKTYMRLLGEQDIHSPHRYFLDESIYEDKILIDVGSAEGLISLNAIEKCKKCILVECEEKWIEALQKTFEPFADKVELIHKYVSNTNSENEIMLDSLGAEFSGQEIIIKMDIEGGEIEALRGGRKLLRDSIVCLAVCVYHNDKDANEIINIFDEYGVNYTFSDGYVLWSYGGNLQPPYFRKCIVRGSNFV